MQDQSNWSDEQMNRLRQGLAEYGKSAQKIRMSCLPEKSTDEIRRIIKILYKTNPESTKRKQEFVENQSESSFQYSSVHDPESSQTSTHRTGNDLIDPAAEYYHELEDFAFDFDK